jgi:hypothetical protein
MAATVLTAVTVIGTGVANNASSVVTAGTVTITVTDLTRTFVRLQNDSTTASAVVTLGAGADPHVASGIGTTTFTLTTAQTQYVGASWDSSRFKTTAGTIVFTFATAATVTVDCGVLTPYGQ